MQWTIGLRKKGVLQALRRPSMRVPRRDACGVAAVAHARASGNRGSEWREWGGEGRARGGGYAAAALERRVAPGKRMRGRLHDPASAHATSSPANSRDITCYHPGSKVTELRCPVPPSLSRSRSSFSGMIRRNDDAGTTFFFSFALRKHFFLRNEEFKIFNSLWNWKARKKRKEKYILFIFRLRSYRLLPFPRPEPVSQLTLICRGYTGWICRESCGKKRQPGTGALDTDYQANKALLSQRRKEARKSGG